MSVSKQIALLELRRDNLLGWVDDEAPYTAADQKHLDQGTPERAYWHHGYQAALTDVIELLSRAEQKSGSAGIPK
jgi:hypothetical protein